MKTASVADLKAHLSGYLRRVGKGEEVVVTSHDHPVAKLVPFHEGGEELSIKYATRPASDIKKIEGVAVSLPIDIVEFLRQDRDRG